MEGTNSETEKHSPKQQRIQKSKRKYSSSMVLVTHGPKILNEKLQKYTIPVLNWVWA